MGKFRIKIKSSWFSEDFIVFRYSTNGIFWKSIKTYEYDVLDKWCYMVEKTSDFNKSECLIKKFNTLEKIKQYESKQRDKVIERNNKILNKRKIKNEKRRNIYKQFG